MNFRILLFWGLFLTTGLINAQSNFVPGYIITADEDTIYGHIDYRSYKAMNTRCIFKAADNTITEYLPNDIQAFRLTDSKYYVSKKVGLDHFFLEYLIKGKVDIYFIRDNMTDRYFLEKEDVMLSEIPYDEGIKHENNMQVQYKTTTHMGYLYYYMQDAPQLQSKIQSIKTPGHKNLISLARDYHNAVCEEDELCVIYEKQLPLIKVSLEPFGGITKAVKWTDKRQFIYGGYIYLSAPRFNDQISLKTGMSVQQLPFEGNDFNLLQFPAQLRYEFKTSWKLKPNISGGWTFWRASTHDRYTLFHTITLNGGLNYKLYEGVSLSTNFESHIVPFSFVFFDQSTLIDLVSYSVNLGVVIEL